jgi:hypothetical protein
MSVVNMIVGAVTPSGATFAAKVSGGGPVRVAVDTAAAMTSPVFTASAAVDAQGVAKVSIAGLAASTRHFWQVEDNGTLDTSLTGQFLTHPPLGVPADVTYAAASCAGLAPEFPGDAGGELDANLVSNHPVHDTIRTQALANGWLGFVHLGDWGYPDWGVNLTDTIANRRTFYDNLLAQSRQAQLFRELPMGYLWDDHDFLANNQRGASTNAATVYRERMPHYSLPDANGIYHSWQVGRVLYIAADVRYFGSANGDPDGPSKTMLGADQKTWMEGVLSASDAKFLVWFLPQQWLGTTTDSWASFQTEQAELVAMFAATGWASRMCIVSGDYHGIAIDTGGNSPGNIPVLQAASMDATPGSGSGGTYTHGPQDGRNQYGTVRVADSGTHMVITLTGWQGDTQAMSFSVGLSITAPTSVATAQVSEFAQVISGSHEPVFDARILTGWRTGPDPAGTTIPILGGDVAYDATAEVFASLSLTTAGIDEHDDTSRFPRLPGDLLAPYGNEIWVRRGVDVGSGVLWASLGYFRIDAAEQDDPPYGPIVLSGQDRMAHLIDARLVVARTFASSNTVAFVFATLVGEVLPQATILFDDATAAAHLGRRLTTEEDRYAVLAELADSYGKVMYWDGDGFLRVESPPDEAVPVWEVAAGPGGVLLTSGRRVTAEGMRNGWVVTGEGGDQQVPVRAVAVDVGASSPTRWGGRFGKRPGFYSSPLIATEAQAETVARAKLLRTLGAPYSVDFDTPVNPALRPHQPIRVEQRDGNREVHVVSSLTIPLTASEQMSGSTREKTHAVIGRVVS